jgi:hypothetical protein
MIQYATLMQIIPRFLKRYCWEPRRFIPPLDNLTLSGISHQHWIPGLIPFNQAQHNGLIIEMKLTLSGMYGS